MDFFQILTQEKRGGLVEAFPDFVVVRSKDLMVRGGKFYAIWDEEAKMWSTDEYKVQSLVDDELRAYAESHPEINSVRYMKSFSTNGWNQYRKFLNQISDNSHQLDQNLTFANTDTKKSDYVSRRLDYNLAEGDHSAWDELVSTLYSAEERAKIEWAIGAVISGDSKKIQKFLVFYGDPGTGKGTVLDIILKLFDGYTATFEAKALGSNNGQFSTEVFRHNPLVAVQHDGDLSGIQDNTRLNSIISHEYMTMNEKYKSSYSTRINAFLFMGTNLPVRISDAKSGIIRRLIDVYPSGVLLKPNRYHTLISRTDFELGAIASHCLEVYRKMGKNYYNGYRPVQMMFQTDVFFNFIEANFDIFKDQNGASLRQAYTLYKEFCADTGIEKPLPQYKVRSQLFNYFEEFQDRAEVDGVIMRSYFSGFTAKPFRTVVKEDDKTVFSLVLDETESIFDQEYANQPAQYGKADETPKQYWTDTPRLIRGEMVTPKPNQVVSTTLADIDTSQLHFVKVPETHIVIDFDLKDDNGEKSLERNLGAASDWPPTYAELSKSGAGVHLHYAYDGDANDLARGFSPGIEIKVFAGDSSLRRRLSKCNNVPVATISSGLPLKEKKVLSATTIQSEKGLRAALEHQLVKGSHPGTKSSIDFIYKILDDAYNSDLIFDVSDMIARIIVFANNSTNHAQYCLKLVKDMKFKSKESSQSIEPPKDMPIVIFDVEVYPNLFVVCWMYEDSVDDTVVRMINPTPSAIEALFSMKLVGFYNRNYDNHMMWACYMGYTNEQLFRLSQKLIDEKNANAKFGEAFKLSYADILDFSSVKMSLKKFQIELGLKHMEMDLPWDQPVPENRIMDVVEYCVNDVLTTRSVFRARKQDFVARQILAELSGLTVNDTTHKHAAQIVFGNDKNPQGSFVYTKLERDFPGYVYDLGKSYYRGELVGEGGLVRAKPGMYEDVALLDVASMHPTSIHHLNAFGEYTPNFWALVQARLAIKGGDYDTARQMFKGKLAPYLTDKASGTALSDALKIIINSVYGLTYASFDNRFRDKRNVDNIVAKRGALFMVDLMFAVEEQGFTVAHIKTDSVKIPNATPEIIEFVKQFGEKYGYTFEYKPEKDFYEKFCLVNDAVYVARKGEDWITVGAQFQQPYVRKALFTREDFTFDDYCITKEVKQGSMYLDFDSEKPMATVDTPTTMHFIGRAGLFVPVKEGYSGGRLYRVKDGKNYAVTGTKGYLWLESEQARLLGIDCVDMSYFERLTEEARNTIDHFGPFSEFVS